MLTLTCNTNATLCADCPISVVITMPDLMPYRAGDELTCSSDGFPPPTYEWTVDKVTSSTALTQTLQEGEHVYACIATVTYFGYGRTCFGNDTRTLTAYSKCHKQYNTTLTILMLTTL